MKHFLTLSLCFLALSLSAQETITYPYNPDGDADGLVAVPDLQDILAVYGNPFTPSEIQIEGQSLSQFLYELEERNRYEFYYLDYLNNSLSLNAWEWGIIPRGIVVEALDMEVPNEYWNTPNINISGNLPNGFSITILTKDLGYYQIFHYGDECLQWSISADDGGTGGWVGGSNNQCEYDQFWGRTNVYKKFIHVNGNWYGEN